VGVYFEEPPAHHIALNGSLSRSSVRVKWIYSKCRGSVAESKNHFIVASVHGQTSKGIITWMVNDGPGER